MRSTMMDVPLTVTALMRYGTSIFAGREVVTWTGESARRQSYGQTGARAARLAGALRALGVDGDQTGRPGDHGGGAARSFTPLLTLRNQMPTRQAVWPFLPE